MYWHSVIKHIRCLPCNFLIAVKKHRTTQGADTPEEKAYQDRRIEHQINHRTLLGFWICPKCKHKTTITDPPLVFVGEDGQLVSKYTDQLDMSKVSFDRYGHAHHSQIKEIL